MLRNKSKWAKEHRVHRKIIFSYIHEEMKKYSKKHKKIIFAYFQGNNHVNHNFQKYFNVKRNILTASVIKKGKITLSEYFFN